MKTADCPFSREFDVESLGGSGSSSARCQGNPYDAIGDEWEEDVLNSLQSLAEEKLNLEDTAAAEKYATCVIQRSPRKTADVPLLKVLARATSQNYGNRSLADDVAVQLSRTGNSLHGVSYLLAEIYLIINDFGLAYRFCRQSMSLRRSLFGKSAGETSRAVALLTTILRSRSAEFDEEQANAFQRLLPANYRHEMLLSGEYSISAPSNRTRSNSRQSTSPEISVTAPQSASPSPILLHDVPDHIPPRRSEEIPSYESVASQIQQESVVEARQILTISSQSDADESASPLFPAIMRKREELTERLISKQKLINVRTSQHNRSFLHVAAREGLKLTCRKLLEKGCEANGRDEWGFTPLHYAAANGRWAVLDILLKEADPGTTGMGRGQVTAADVVDPAIRVPSTEGENRTSAGERRRLEEVLRRVSRGRRFGSRDDRNVAMLCQASTQPLVLSYAAM